MPRRDKKTHLDWKCRQCSDSFNSERGLNIHVARSHKQAGNKRPRRAGCEGEGLEGYAADSDVHHPAALSGAQSHAPSVASTETDHSSSSEAEPSSSSENDAGGHSDQSVRLEVFENSEDDADGEVAIPAAAAAAAAADDDDDDDDAAGGGGVAAPLLPGAHAAVGPALQPINTGIHALPKQTAAEGPTLSFSEKLLGGLIYKHLSNSAGDDFIEAVKHADFRPEDLPDTAATLKSRVEGTIFASQPLFAVTQTSVPLEGLEAPEPPPGWNKAKVTSRGVVASLMTILMNKDISWDDMFQFEPAAAQAGESVADEPFFGTECQQGCADAIARGTASGEWAAKDVFPLPVMWSVDGQAPDNIGNSTITPCAVNIASFPAEIRRRLDIGQHTCLFPSFPVGHTRTPKVTRDHRRVRQAAYKVFADEFNDVFKRGFVLHGSQIKGCPHNRPLRFMPFALGCAFDAEGAWHWCNSKSQHCYVCSANYDESKVFPVAGAALSPRLTQPAASLRSTIHSPAASVPDKRAAVRALKELSLHPEPTAHDSIAQTQMRGHQNVYPDSMHCVEGGICKVAVVGIKQACGDAKMRATDETGHSLPEATKILDDFVTHARGFSNGIHRLPAVKGFSAVRVFTAMMIRSLTFTLLAALCCVSDLFNDSLQDATIAVLALCVMLIRNVNLRRWTPAVPARISKIYKEMARHWEDSIVEAVAFFRPKVHLVSHYGDLFRALGTPIHWSTMYFIEPLQRLVKSAYRHSSRFNADGQIMKRLVALGQIEQWIQSMLGGASDRRRKRDEPYQAYLRGSLEAIPGVNTIYAVPHTDDAFAWNADMQRAIMASGELPKGHIVTQRRIFVRREGTFIREGQCDVTVRAGPQIGGGPAERAIFSRFAAREAPPVVAAGGDAGPDGVGAPPEVQHCESMTDRFVVDWWISYDIRGLSTEHPNGSAELPKLTSAQVNDAACAIDLAIGRKLQLAGTVTGTGRTLRESYAKAIFQRVKPTGKITAIGVGALCQPLWAFPALGDFRAAKAFFRGTMSSKWDASQWLILPKLY
jgi:hypothetical protein